MSKLSPSLADDKSRPAVADAATPHPHLSTYGGLSYRDFASRARRDLLERLLVLHGGVVAAVARELRIDRKTAHAWITGLDLRHLVQGLRRRGGRS